MLADWKQGVVQQEAGITRISKLWGAIDMFKVLNVAMGLGVYAYIKTY